MAVTKVTTELIEDNSITHDHIHNSLLVTSSEGISASNNDVTVPTSLAVSNYVDSAVSSLVDSSPANLDTLNELAAALNNDADFATTVTNSIADKVGGTGTTNYVMKWSDSNNAANSSIFDNGTRVGIGTNNPVNNLHLHSTSATSIIKITNPSTGLGAFDGISLALGNIGADLFSQLWFYENGYFRIATNNTERMRITSTGDVGIGTPSPSAKLDVNGSISATSLTETSALRFKENIQEDIDSSIIDKLRPVSYDWKENNKKDYGFIAEEVDELNPLLTTKNEDGEMLGIKYTKLIPFLVKKIQEQEKRIIELENGQS